MSKTYAFAGGGTLGPVTPLLAVESALKELDSKAEFIWFGTSSGPEKILLEPTENQYYVLPIARLTRYLSWELLLAPFRFWQAFLKARRVLKKEQVNFVGMAGGFTGVPVVYAAWTLRIPVWIHQPDVLPVLSNRLTAVFAKIITVSWPQSLPYFSNGRTEVYGNPVREAVSFGLIKNAQARFSLDKNLPTVLFFGGGGGARQINELCLEILPKLSNKANVIHVTGVQKEKNSTNKKNYHVYELLNEEEMADALSVADVVVSRAGMGAIGELSLTKKATIFLPLLGSQSANAEAVKKLNGGLVYQKSSETNKKVLTDILRLLKSKDERELLGNNLHSIFPENSAMKIAKKLLNY